MALLMHKGQIYSGGKDGETIIYLTKAEYDQITPLQDQTYGIIDWDSEAVALIKDGVIVNNATWSSQKINNELGLKVNKTQISNPNLLDNPWFTVNQRGLSSYQSSTSKVYTVDRWCMTAGAGLTATVNSDHSVSIENTSGNVYGFWQFFENDLPAGTYTLTIDCDDNNNDKISSIVFYDNSFNAVATYYQKTVTFTVDSTGYRRLAIYIKAGKTLSIRAVKLEVGSISTLHLDTAPNYATELLKCQRYFVRYKQTNANAMEYGFMVASTTTSAHGIVNLPTSMRTTPSLVVADATKLALYGQYKYSLTALSIAICDDQNMVVKLSATTSGMTAGMAYMLSADTGYGFDLSADL